MTRLFASQFQWGGGYDVAAAVLQLRRAWSSTGVQVYQGDSAQVPPRLATEVPCRFYQHNLKYWADVQLLDMAANGVPTLKPEQAMQM